MKSTSSIILMDPSLERTFRGHKDYITSVNFSPNLKYLASGGGDNSIMLWNFKPQLRAFRFVGHKGVVTDLQFSPEGDVLASASKDKTVRIWVPNAKGESVVLKGHIGAVRSVDFSTDSRHLITGSDDKTAKIWSLPNRKFACSLVDHSNWVRSACFSPDTKLAATGSDDKLVKLWDVSTHQLLHTFHDHTDGVNSVVFHTEGNCLASGSADRTLKMWDVRSHLLIQHYPAHDDSISSISMHPSGYYLLSSSKDMSLKIWDLREGRLLFTLQGHSGPVNCARFSKDGDFFASGGADQLVMLWKSNLYGVGEQEEAEKAVSLRSSTSSYTNIGRESASASGSRRATTAPMTVTPQKLRNTKTKSTSIRDSSEESSLFRQRRSDIPHEAASPLKLAGQSAAYLTSSAPSSSFSSSNSTSITRTAGHRDVSSSRMEEEDQGGRWEGGSRITKEANVQASLSHIAGQLDLIMKTMQIMDERLTLTESRVSSILSMQRGVNPVMVSNLPSATFAQSSSIGTANGNTTAAFAGSNRYEDVKGPSVQQQAQADLLQQRLQQQQLQQQIFDITSRLSIGSVGNDERQKSSSWMISQGRQTDERPTDNNSEDAETVDNARKTDHADHAMSFLEDDDFNVSFEDHYMNEEQSDNNSEEEEDLN